MNRQKTLLFILLILFLAAVMYAYVRFPRQKSVEKLKYAPGISAVSKEQSPIKPASQTQLHLALLDQPLPQFTGYKRNIFALASPETRRKLLPPPPPPPPPVPPPPPPPSPAQVRQEAAKAEMAKFTFLGFLKKQNKKLIFLSKDKEIFVSQEGDKIGNDFIVTSITDDVLTIHASSGGGELIIPLLENQPLQPSPRK